MAEVPFWFPIWSHCDWQATLERVGARGNTGDLDAQPFYRFITKTYPLHVVASFAALYAFGGLPALVWGGALRAVWVRFPCAVIHAGLPTTMVVTAEQQTNTTFRNFLLQHLKGQSPAVMHRVSAGGSAEAGVAGAGLPRHVVCELGQPRVGQPGVQNRRPVPQQLVRILLSLGLWPAGTCADENITDSCVASTYACLTRVCNVSSLLLCIFTRKCWFTL